MKLVWVMSRVSPLTNMARAVVNSELAIGFQHRSAAGLIYVYQDIIPSDPLTQTEWVGVDNLQSQEC
jgi:hypothetical protein